MLQVWCNNSFWEDSGHLYLQLCGLLVWSLWETFLKDCSREKCMCTVLPVSAGNRGVDDRTALHLNLAAFSVLSSIGSL